MVKGEKERVKHLISDLHLIPKVAILDPRMTLSLPKQMTAATGADALSHAIESLYAVLSGPLTDGLALHAVRLIIDHLPRCVKNGSDLEARGMQLIASCMAGMAFQNALVGVAHGIANGILLPYGLEFNAETSAHRYRMLAPIFVIQPEGKEISQITKKIIQSLIEFLRGLGLPQKLSEVGVKENQLQACA